MLRCSIDIVPIVFRLRVSVFADLASSVGVVCTVTPRIDHVVPPAIPSVEIAPRKIATVDAKLGGVANQTEVVAHSRELATVRRIDDLVVRGCRRARHHDEMRYQTFFRAMMLPQYSDPM